MDSFYSLASARQSCRNYNPDKKVSREELTACLEAARIAPSACNSQPWSFHGVLSHDKAKLMGLYLQKFGLNKFAEKCPAFVVVVEEKAKLIARIAGKLGSQEYASIDIGIAAAHFCLAACDIGLSTCITGCFDEGKIKELLDIPKNKRIRLVICVGYAADDDKLRPKTRKDFEEIVKFD